MFKRIMLTLTFLAAFSTIGVGFTSSADAWRGWRRPYAAYYYGPPSAYYYGYGTPYRAYYAPRYYRPYSYSYPPYYYGYGPGAYYYGPRGRVAFRIGW